jgi:hypothetical protein
VVFSDKGISFGQDEIARAGEFESEFFRPWRGVGGFYLAWLAFSRYSPLCRGLFCSALGRYCPPDFSLFFFSTPDRY